MNPKVIRIEKPQGWEVPASPQSLEKPNKIGALFYLFLVLSLGFSTATFFYLYALVPTT